MLRWSTICRKIRLSAPKKKVDVRLAAPRFLGPGPHHFPPQAKKMVRVEIRRSRKKKWVCFRRRRKKIGLFFVIFSTISYWTCLWLSIFRGLSSILSRFSLSEDETSLHRLANVEERVVSMILLRKTHILSTRSFYAHMPNIFASGGPPRAPRAGVLIKPCWYG